MRKLIYLWLMVALPTCLLAQQAAIKGKVTNMDGAVPPGACIISKGSDATHTGATLFSDAAISNNAPAGATEITFTLTLQKTNYI